MGSGARWITSAVTAFNIECSHVCSPMPNRVGVVSASKPVLAIPFLASSKRQKDCAKRHRGNPMKIKHLSSDDTTITLSSKRYKVEVYRDAQGQVWVKVKDRKLNSRMRMRLSGPIG